MALPPLTADALAPFARIVRAVDGKYTHVHQVLEPGDVPGHHEFVVLCPAPVPAGDVTIASLERHPHSTQTFLPISVGRWIVLVAPTLPDGPPDVAGARAFVAGPSDAICIGRNVWHAGLTVLDRPAEVGMIMWRADTDNDGIVHELKTPIVLSV